MKYCEWVIRNYDPSVVSRLTQELKISSLAAKILSARGIHSVLEAETFLDTDIEKMHDPFLLKGMEDAVNRIILARERGEKVTVYGDYDADGVTSTYILVDYLRSHGVACTYYIPDRVDEGYGINNESIDKIKDIGVTLIITVDTGVTAVSEAIYAKENGIDLIVCDHHECKGELPDACSIVNPRLSDCTYPFKHLAGVGVVLKLIAALDGGTLTEQSFKKYVSICALGTVADIMPIIGENRVIVTHGLSYIPKTKNPGLKALITAVGADKREITTGTISFMLAPRINAAGRMGCARRAVELFLTNDEEKAEMLALELHNQNLARQELEKNIYEQAEEQIFKTYNPNKDKAIVLVGQDWHHGVLGIVASRICEKYSRPTILISSDGVYGKGSGRSVKGVNLYKALHDCSHLLEKYGGHELAVGLSLPFENFVHFKRLLNEHIEEDMCGWSPSIEIDFKVEPDELTLPEIEGISVLEPFGSAHTQPLLFMEKAMISSVVPIGGNKHIKIELVKNGVKLTSVFFGKVYDDFEFSQGDYIDLLFCPTINDFKGKNVQLVIRDIRPAFV